MPSPESCRAALAVADACLGPSPMLWPVLASVASLACAVWQGWRCQRFARLNDSLVERNENLGEQIAVADAACRELGEKLAKWTTIPTPKSGKRSP